MTTQSEQTLENNLLVQLEGMEYTRVDVPDEPVLLANLQKQIEKHNDITLSDKEFKKVLNHLNKGNVYDRAKILRDRMSLLRDDGTHKNVEFINQKKWCQNTFQVTNQTTMQGDYKNRYDVTILINGLPLVQIELKRRGLELKEAFNQVNRYRRHSYSAGQGLFLYIQLFVISNGVNTKYYSNTVGYDNDKKASYKFTSFWTDTDNNKITQLDDFAKVFLEKCHLAKMITHYTVLNTKNQLLVLRPYQYYAVEAIIDRVKNTEKNGYIWHTTGSGKTLTSFKASQILTELPNVDKVVFVVDRKDLDDQTVREFNSFKENSVDVTDNTKYLVKQFGDDTKLIVTTIQKLDNAITHNKHAKTMESMQDKKVIFVFDECHRSQFGNTHKRITEYFKNYQMFGFTGTPIFKDNASSNAHGKRTTKELFDDALHKYVITDAIGDENVLKFSVEYVGKYRQKDSANEVDIEIEDIDRKELMESPERIEKITDYIIANHSRKTHAREFTAILCVSSIDVLTEYYEFFRRKKEEGKHNLKVATIFSYGTNEEDKDADGMLDEDVQLEIFDINKHSRDKLESYMGDYNKMFDTSYTTKDSKSFYNYYRNIAKRVKNREIDILIVVNMFLTGFDSVSLNTMYVDKNLRYHGLLQAYSRTNRILNETKSQGNIVVFRNLRGATNKAIELFANKDANEIIFSEPYEVYLKQFNQAITDLKKIVATPGDVDSLEGETAENEFVQTYRNVLRLRNVLISFADFDYANTEIEEQELDDYKSKYLDIYDKVRSDKEKEKVSILDDVDFELELIARDIVNVDFILSLLARMVGSSGDEKTKLLKQIQGTLSTDPKLRSKRELIEKFIESNLPKITEGNKVESEFQTFWDDERVKAFQQMCEEEGLMSDELQRLIDSYLFSGRKPRDNDIASTLKTQPKIIERDSVLTTISNKITKFIDTFIEGV